MHLRPTVSYEQATALIDAALDRARESHGPSAAVACAVVGSVGELVAFGAQDGTGALPRRLAARKAYSAVLFKRETLEVRTAVEAGAIPLVSLGDDALLPIPGGVPVRVDGEIIGAVGVSGMTPDQDHAIAAFASRAVPLG